MPYSIDLRQRVVDAYNEDIMTTYKQIAQRFSVSESFVSSTLKTYRQTGSVKPKVRQKQTPTKLSDEQLLTLKSLIDEDNDATLKELCIILEEKTNVSIAVSTMGRMTQKLNITVKKKTLRASQKDSDRIQLARIVFWQLIHSFKAEDLVFIDESGINLGLERTRGRAEKGHRAYGKKPHIKGANISLIAALGMGGVITEVSLTGSTDTLTFDAFIINKLAPNLWPGAVVIMDRCPIHLGHAAAEAIHNAGAHLILLPGYSPDFSPIENAWSKLKSILCGIGARNYPDLLVAIKKAYSQIAIEDILGWYTHCCYCTESDWG
jgi:transposase